MLLKTSPGAVVWRGTYSTDGDGRERIAFKSGALVEHVKIVDHATGEVLDWTLAEGLNGDVAVGANYSFTVEMTTEQVAAGNGRVRTKYKHRIVSAELVAADAAARKAA